MARALPPAAVGLALVGSRLGRPAPAAAAPELELLGSPEPAPAAAVTDPPTDGPDAVEAVALVVGNSAPEVPGSGAWAPADGMSSRTDR